MTIEGIDLLRLVGTVLKIGDRAREGNPDRQGCHSPAPFTDRRDCAHAPKDFVEVWKQVRESRGLVGVDGD